jgi:hypothetical protein
MASIEDLQKRVDDILSGRGKGNQFIADTAATTETTPQQWYSEFSSSDQRGATELASRLMRIADEKGGEEGLADAVSEIERENDTDEKPSRVQHATELFLTHHPQARAKLRLKPLEKRQPDLVRPSKVSKGPADSAAPSREQGI